MNHTVLTTGSLLLLLLSLAPACGEDGSSRPPPTDDASVPPSGDAAPDGEADAAEPDGALPGLALTVGDRHVVRVGASVQVPIALERSGGFSAPVEVTVAGLPIGATASPVAIPSDASEGVVTIEVSGTADTGQRVAVEVLATGDGLVATAQTKLFTVGEAGEPDAAFGGATGVADSLASGFEGGMFVLPLSDGTVLVAGRGVAATVHKRRASGQLDTRFAEGGVLTIESGSDWPCDFDALPDGRAALYFQETSTSRVVGLNDDGSIDPAFDFDALEHCNRHGLLVGDDGRLTLSGVGPMDETLERRLTTGAFDTAFGDGGSLSVDTVGMWGALTAWQVPVSDGKVVALFRATVDGVRRLGLVRYTDAGELDASYGDGGIALVGVGGLEPRSLVRESEDRLVVVAFQEPNATVVTWLDADGNPFSPPQTTSMIQAGAFPQAVASDGAGGTLLLYSEWGGFCHIRKITPTGANDPDFGTDGVATLSTPNGGGCFGLGVEEGVRVVATGWDRAAPGGEFRTWVAQVWL